MHPTVKKARIAGFLYVCIGLLAPFGLLYVPRTLIVTGNAGATANNILAHEMLFRAGIVTGLASAVIFIWLVIALHGLLSSVSRAHARMMVVLVLASATIAVLNEVNSIAALTLFHGADFLSAFDRPQQDALGMLFLDLYRQVLVVNQILWGLWLFPFGVLVMRSGFVPRILGVLLVVNGFAYVLASFTSLLLPDYAKVVSRAILPALLGEVWIMLWLLIKGARVERLPASVP